MPETRVVEFSSNYSFLFSNMTISGVNAEEIQVPEIAFSEIKFPVKKVRKVKLVAKLPKKLEQKSAEMTFEKVAKNELPFHDPIKLVAIKMENELPKNLVALYSDFSFEMVAEISTEAPIQDEITTTMAASEEPEFFSYGDEKEVPTENQNPVPQKEIAQQTASANNQVEEIAVDELVTFDYSKAKEDVKLQTMPVYTTVTSQALGQTNILQESKAHESKPAPTPDFMTTQDQVEDEDIDKKKSDQKGIVPVIPPMTYDNRLTIQISGTDLKKVSPEVGFELRFQDDLNETIQDYNTGSVTIEQKLSEAKMTRSVTVLKRGFAPTNTDLILEEGAAELVLPLIEEDTFNELMAPFESRGPIGAVLVELDNSTVGAVLDVPYSQVLKLNENLNVTEDEDYIYQLFVGVKAGNALLSYKNDKNEKISKIIHIHERELSYESNFYEDVQNDSVKLKEENLLGKESTPLIISSEQVKLFATDKTAHKINDHTHRTSFKKTLLGSRRYLELTHQSEPVFIGMKDNTQLEIPSENFMRYILSKFEGSSLGNRCLIQVNLKKKAMKVDVGSESIASSLMTHVQILDADGQFYSTLDEKSRKIIVVGESHASPELGQEGKINLKITYQDESVQFIGSYCSPNTYLVEQL